MHNLPFKVTLFIAQPVGLQTIQALAQSGYLAGVVLPAQADPFTEQLEQQLIQQGVPNARLIYGQEHQVIDNLSRWETDAIVAFGFSGDVPEALVSATPGGYFNLLLADPSQCAGPMPLYWLICRGESHGEAVLMRASDNGDKGVIVARQQYQIDPLDTYKLLENKVAQMAAQCVMSFVDASVNENTSLLADKVPGETALTHLPNEQDLVVNFGQMTSIQIADMARAGNPVFSGCTIYLGQTPLSLMQATAIKYPTYGVEPGTICHTGEPDGVVVATKDGALRLDVIANMDGVFSGCAFVERFQVSAGMSFS